MAATRDDALFMARALQLAETGLYTTDPNPRVGCVIVQNGEVVGEGAHQFAGGPHAEVHALQAAGERAKGAVAYVSLEPCCHYGRTPPCTEALVTAGISRVVAAMSDPNPRVAGQGLAALQRSGISTEVGLMQSQAQKLNPGFISRMKHGRPFIRIKLAASLDGRTALSDGESKWITGEAAREDVQRLRARSSAVMTGIGTVLADDPSLTIRGISVPRQPLRVVVDRRLRMPATARMLALPGQTLIATTSMDPRPDLAASNAEVFVLGQEGEFDFEVLFVELARRETNEVLVEAGASLSGALLARHLVDEIVIYFAPHFLGSTARGMFELPPLVGMDERIALEITDVRSIGPDWRFTAILRK